MVSIPVLSWSVYYARNRDDEGSILSLFEKTWEGLATKTVSHLSNTVRLAETVGGNMFGSVMLVPGPPGRMQMLHQGFTSDTDDAGFSLIFAQGNLGECSYFKVVPRAAVTEPIKVTQGGRVIPTTNCPTLETMLAATTGDEFKELEAQGNVILRQKRNHLMIHPEAFLMMDGAATFQAKDVMAITILDMVRPNPDDDEEEDETVEAKKKAAAGAELVLAFLWASEQGTLTPVQLLDVHENPHLKNQIIRSIKAKLGGSGGTLPPRESVTKMTTTEEPNGRNSGQARVRALSRNSIGCMRVAKLPGT